MIRTCSLSAAQSHNQLVGLYPLFWIKSILQGRIVTNTEYINLYVTEWYKIQCCKKFNLLTKSSYYHKKTTNILRIETENSKQRKGNRVKKQSNKKESVPSKSNSKKRKSITSSTFSNEETDLESQKECQKLHKPSNGWFQHHENQQRADNNLNAFNIRDQNLYSQAPLSSSSSSSSSVVKLQQESATARQLEYVDLNDSTLAYYKHVNQTNGNLAATSGLPTGRTIADAVNSLAVDGKQRQNTDIKPTVTSSEPEANAGNNFDQQLGTSTASSNSSSGNINNSSVCEYNQLR